MIVHIHNTWSLHPPDNSRHNNGKQATQTSQQELVIEHTNELQTGLEK